MRFLFGDFLGEEMFCFCGAIFWGFYNFDEEIAEIVDKTIKDIISGMAGVELEEIKEGNGYTEVHITGNANPIELSDP